MVMSFIKVAILSTLGEVIKLRISTGSYHRRGVLVVCPVHLGIARIGDQHGFC